MTSSILIPTFTRTDSRGLFVELMNSDISWKNFSNGKMHKNAIIGQHYHKKTTVFFYVLNGEVEVYNYDVKTHKNNNVILHSMQGILFKPYMTHAIIFKKQTSFLMGKSHKFNQQNSDTFEYPVPGTPTKKI